MAKINHRAVEMTCTLTLTERETKMLAWLAGYGGEQIARAITDKLSKQYSSEEWEGLWTEIRNVLEQATIRFRETRQVFEGTKKAVSLEELVK